MVDRESAPGELFGERGNQDDEWDDDERERQVGPRRRSIRAQDRGDRNDPDRRDERDQEAEIPDAPRRSPDGFCEQPPDPAALGPPGDDERHDGGPEREDERGAGSETARERGDARRDREASDNEPGDGDEIARPGAFPNVGRARHASSLVRIDEPTVTVDLSARIGVDPDS